MRGFQPVDGACEAELEEFEVALLTSLAEQLQAILGGDDEDDLAGLDAFQRLAAESSAGVELDRDDPLIERLFPAAYRDDKLDAEYRRFTDDDARRARVAQARIVLADLAATGDGTRPLRVGPENLDAWLKTVNALRLSLSVRLGIVDAATLDALEALPARDPRAHLLDLYEWLGYVLESLLDAATPLT